MSKLIRKFTAIAVSLTVGLMLAGPVPAQALTAEELQAQINDLMATLAALQAQLAGLEGGAGGTSGTVPSACVGISSFDRNLKQGMSGADVKCLQALLNTDTATQVAASGVGSAGSETQYFGTLTKAAVIKFQEKYAPSVLAPWGLTSGTGYVGSTSRAKLDEMLGGIPEGCSCTSWANDVCGAGACSATQRQQTRTCTPSACAAETQCAADAACGTVPSTGLGISLASDTPAAGSVAKGAYGVPVVKFNFTAGSDGNKTVTKIILKRNGMSQDADVDTIKLYDGSTQIGSSQALNTTTHKVTFKGLNWSVPAGTTKVLTVKADFATSSTVGDSVNFGIDSADDVVTSQGASITGVPVYGNTKTIAGISVGRLDVDILATPGASDVISGSSEQHVTSIKFTASATEGFDVHMIKLAEAGTSAAGDIKNVKLKYIGEQVGSTVAELDSNEEVTFEGEPLFSLKAGTSKTIDVYVDISADVRSARTINFQVPETSYVLAYGQNTGGGVTITGANGATYTNDTSDADDTIRQGTLTINWDTATNPSATYYTVGTEQNTIASFKFSASSREGIVITKLKLNEGGTITDTEYQNVQLYIDGSAVSTGHVGSVSSAIVTFQDSDGLFTVPKGSNVVVAVKADISTSATNARTIKFHIGAVTNITMEGVDSQAKIDSVAANITYSAVDTAGEATAHTVKSYGNLTISNSPDTPAGTNLTLGQQDIEVLRFRLAAEYEDMLVSSIKVRFYTDANLSDAGTDEANAATTTTYLQNIRLYETSPSGTLIKQVASPSAGYVNFNTNTTVSKNTTKTYSVVADLPTTSNLIYLAGAVGAFTGSVGITAGNELTTTGVSSAQDITETGGAYGNSFTLRTPTLAVDAASYPPASNPYVVSNTAAAHLGRLVLTGSYEDIKVTQVVITFDDAAALQGESSAEDIFTNVMLKQGSTQVGATKKITDGGITGAVTARRDRVTFDGITNLKVLKDQSIYLDIYADVTATSSDTNNLDWFVGHASNSDIVGTGTYSNTSVTSTGGKKASNKTETLSSGTLTISVDSDTPVATNHAVGVSGVSSMEFTKLKFEALFEDMKVKTLKLTLSDADTTSATSTAGAYDFNNVYLYDGSTQLATAVVDPTNSTVLFTKDTGLFTVANGTAKVITVKADVKGIGSGVLSGDSPKFYITNLQDTARVQAEGVSSNASTSATDGTPNPETVGNVYSQYLYKTNVTVAKNASCPSGSQSAQSNAEVFRFDVTADSKSEAVLNTVAINISGSADLGTGATGNAYLYKSTDMSTALATETYKKVTIPATSYLAAASTTAATSTQGAFDRIPVGSTVHVYDASAATVTWDTAKVVGVDDDSAYCAAGSCSRIRFDHALTFGVTGSDVIYYQPLQPGEGKLYFGGMTYLTATTSNEKTYITVNSTDGFASGDTVVIWGYGLTGTATSSVSLTVATTTEKRLYFDTRVGITIDYNYEVESATDGKVQGAVVYTNEAANNVEEAISAGTTKTFVVKGDTTGAASYKTIGLIIDSAADLIWGDNKSWPSSTNGVDNVRKYIYERTKTFPISTTLTY